MPLDLRDALRDALAVSVPPAPTDSIRNRARKMSRDRLARSLSGTIALAVCSLCFWLSGASHASTNGGGLPGANLPTPVASTAPAIFVTPGPRPAPGPAIS
jgi:hypothetical protein